MILRYVKQDIKAIIKWSFIDLIAKVYVNILYVYCIYLTFLYEYSVIDKSIYLYVDCYFSIIMYVFFCMNDLNKNEWNDMSR